jgi:hypothetical protein
MVFVVVSIGPFMPRVESAIWTFAQEMMPPGIVRLPVVSRVR